MQDDELARWLGSAAFQVLSQWQAQRHLDHRFVRAFDNGATDAKVMVVDRHDELNNTAVRLVLKLDRFTGTDFGTTEYARHGQAIRDSGSWAVQHLARLVDSPIPVDGGWWLIFQSVAGNLDQFTLLGNLVRELSDENAEPSCTSAELVEFFVAIVTGVLAEWAGQPNVTYISVPEFLEAHLGYRLAEGKPLQRMLGSSSEPTLALLRDHSLTDRVELTVPVGIGHGDLHVDNAMVRIRPSAVPGDFRLIDLAKCEAAGPLGRDPAHLLVHMINGALRGLAPSALGPLRRVLLDPEHVQRDRLPVWLRDIITRTYEAAEHWIEPFGYGADWRLQRPLSLYAATLMVYVRDATRPEDKPWLKALADEAAETFLAKVKPGSSTKPATLAAQRYVELEEDASDIAAPAAPSRSRVIAEDRASLRAPSVTAISRTELLASAIGRRDKRTPDQRHRQILALLGEGGIGKTVLLGQYLDQLDDADHAVVLVACGSISSAAELTSAAEADVVFGLAADLRYGREGLLALLAAQQVAFGAVTLLVDTIDLVISQDSAPSIASLLAEAVKVADVVITCRTFEFSNHLLDATRLIGRITTYDLPKLDEREIVRWAEWFLSTGERTADHSMFIESLSGAISASKALQQVCSLPVRLALACLTFADCGAMPEDLSVTGLYQEYWNARVRAYGSDKERAALEVARHVVTRAGRFTMRVPKALVPESLRAGLEELISEGVLHEHALHWELFHQTFAEFAHARWALTHGVESDEISHLIERTTSGAANSWAVLLSMLLQVDEFADYQVVARLIPMTSADAVQIQTLGALQRAESEALDSVLTSLAEHLELLPVTLDALRDAPVQHVPTAVVGAVQALSHSSPLAAKAVDTLTRLLPREAASADLLRTALEAVSGVADAEERERYFERSVTPFIAVRASDEKLAVLREMYPRLRPMGMRCAIRAHRVAGVPNADFLALARIALNHECPPLDDREQIDLLTALWRDSVQREQLGWDTWREVLAASLPKGWNNGQVKFVAALAEVDDSLAGQVFDELMLGESTAEEPHVNAAALMVSNRPVWAAQRLLAKDPPDADIALNAIGKITPDLAAGLDHPARLRLMEWLGPRRASHPRAVWPTQFVLAGDDLDTYRALWVEFEQTDPESALLIAVLQTVFHYPLDLLTQLAGELRETIDTVKPRSNSPAAEKLRIRARLEGRLAESDAVALDWITQQVVSGASPSVAGTVVKTIADEHPEGLPESMSSSVATLLRTRHSDAAQRLTALLLERPDNVSVDAVIDRMRTAADQREDSRLSRSLLELVVKIDEITPVTESDVRRICEIVRSRVSGSDVSASDRSAAVRDLSSLAGRLMPRRLEPSVVRDLIGGVLTGFTPGQLGSKLVVRVTSMLLSLLRRDPDSPAWLISIFGRPATALEVKLAIAEAFLLYEHNRPGGYASALKDRADCPLEVATLIVPRLVGDG